MAEFHFDVTITTVDNVTVIADSVEEARELLEAHGLDWNAGHLSVHTEDGDPEITFELIEDEA